MEKLKTVLLIGPIDLNGRLIGGVATMLSSILKEANLFNERGFTLRPFNTCYVKRKSKTAGRFTLSNVINYRKCRNNLIHICRSETPDIVYLHSSVGFALVKDLLLCKSIRPYAKKIVIHIHSSDPKAIFLKSDFLKKYVIRNLKYSCDEVIVLSDAIKNYLLGLGLLEKRCHVVPNFTTMTFSDEDMKQKQMNRVSDPFLNMLFVGSLTKQKGIFDLLESLTNIQGKYRLRICGSPVNKDDENKINHLASMNKNIELLGFVSGKAKREVFKESDVIILPSYTEGLPVSLIEGVTFGCYVISTPVGSIPEYFSSSGKLIPVGDQQALKSAIAEVIQSKEKIVSLQMIIHSNSSVFSVTKFVTEVCSVFTN